ncbi:MAG: DUF4878 domain-containing protein [Candidatus Dormibacteraeota bacterium]|nr:DUF4878 domain-containing protein [Candidatus Dormibacteraeota bacterium]
MGDRVRGHLLALVRPNRAAMAALSAGVFLASTIVACGDTTSPYLTSISGATDQSTPQNAVRGFFNELVKGDYRGAQSYVNPSEQQTYAAAVQSASGKNYTVQITSFRIVAFDTPGGSTGNVGVKVDGQTCVSGKCNPISTTADNSASIPVTQVNNQWYLTGVSAP